MHVIPYMFHTRTETKFSAFWGTPTGLQEAAYRHHLVSVPPIMDALGCGKTPGVLFLGLETLSFQTQLFGRFLFQKSSLLLYYYIGIPSFLIQKGPLSLLYWNSPNSV